MQASSVGEGEDGGCLQEMVASLDASCSATWTPDGSACDDDDAPAAARSAAAAPHGCVWHASHAGGGSEAAAPAPTVLLFGAYVQLHGDFWIPLDMDATAAVAHHGGCAVLNVARMGDDATVLLRAGARITHPLNVHPGCNMG